MKETRKRLELECERRENFACCFRLNRVMTQLQSMNVVTISTYLVESNATSSLCLFCSFSFVAYFMTQLSNLSPPPVFGEIRWVLNDCRYWSYVSGLHGDIYSQSQRKVHCFVCKLFSPTDSAFNTRGSIKMLLIDSEERIQKLRLLGQIGCLNTTWGTVLFAAQFTARRHASVSRPSVISNLLVTSLKIGVEGKTNCKLSDARSYRTACDTFSRFFIPTLRHFHWHLTWKWYFRSLTVIASVKLQKFYSTLFIYF
jgi:hypothetical protein